MYDKKVIKGILKPDPGDGSSQFTALIDNRNVYMWNLQQADSESLSQRAAGGPEGEDSGKFFQSGPSQRWLVGEFGNSSGMHGKLRGKNTQRSAD